MAALGAELPQVRELDARGRPGQPWKVDVAARRSVPGGVDSRGIRGTTVKEATGMPN